MELVTKLTDILENAKRFDKYLHSINFHKKDFAVSCLKRGRCFVVIKEGGKYKFYPSKFIGYQDNSNKSYNAALDDACAIPNEKGKPYHDADHYTFDGRMSNKAINKILGCTCEKDPEMAQRFIEYCNDYGLAVLDNKKFWLNVIEQA